MGEPNFFSEVSYAVSLLILGHRPNPAVVHATDVDTLEELDHFYYSLA
jgi:hypothetical protein